MLYIGKIYSLFPIEKRFLSPYITGVILIKNIKDWRDISYESNLSG